MPSEERPLPPTPRPTGHPKASPIVQVTLGVLARRSLTRPPYRNAVSFERAVRTHAVNPCLLLLAGLSFVLSLQVAVAMPPLEQVDERAHAAYAIALADGHLPTINTMIPYAPQRYPALAEALVGNDLAHRQIWTANHPPLYYALSVPLVWLGDALGHPGFTLLGMRVLNGLGMALSVLLIGLIARELVPRRPMVPILAAAFAVSCGAVTNTGGAIYNDGLASAAAFLALFVGLRIIRDGPSRRRLTVATAACVAAASLRSSGLVAVAMTCAAVLAAVVLRDRSRAGLWRGLWLAAPVGVVPALAIGWFYVRNIHLYGDPTASAALFAKFERIRNGTTLGQLTSRGFYQHFFGSLWTDGDLSNHWGILGWVLMAAIALGLILEGRRWLDRRASAALTSPTDPAGRAREIAAWGLIGLYTALVTVSTASFIAGGGWIHARYAIPALPLLSTAAAVATLRLGRLVPALRVSGIGTPTRDLRIALPVSLAFASIAVVCHLDTERFIDGVTSTAQAGLLVTGDLLVFAVLVAVFSQLRRRLARETAPAWTAALEPHASLSRGSGR